MHRIQLTDSSGRWFNFESAVEFHEATRWNGQNHVSLATGDQWCHQRLYFTASGAWIRNCWSQWQGSLESYNVIDDQTAITWLILNEHTDSDEVRSLPPAVQQAIADQLASNEV